MIDSSSEHHEIYRPIFNISPTRNRPVFLRFRRRVNRPIIRLVGPLLYIQNSTKAMQLFLIFCSTNQTLNQLINRQSHAGTVGCFRDDNASQWKSGKFNPRSLKNPWTDRHPVQNFITIRLRLPLSPPEYAKMRIKWLG